MKRTCVSYYYTGTCVRSLYGRADHSTRCSARQGPGQQGKLPLLRSRCRNYWYGAGAALFAMKPEPHFLLWSRSRSFLLWTRCRTFFYVAGAALFAMEPVPQFLIWSRSRTFCYGAGAALFVMEAEPHSLIWSRSHVFCCGAGAAPNVRLRRQL